MFGIPPTTDLPPDQYMLDLIGKIVAAYYTRDMATGDYYLQELKKAFPAFMQRINPTLKKVVKRILKDVEAGAVAVPPGVQQAALSSQGPNLQPSVGPNLQPSASAGPNLQPSPVSAPSSSSAPSVSPLDLADELSSAIGAYREKRKEKITEELDGTLEDLAEL